MKYTVVGGEQADSKDFDSETDLTELLSNANNWHLFWLSIVYWDIIRALCLNLTFELEIIFKRIQNDSE